MDYRYNKINVSSRYRVKHPACISSSPYASMKLYDRGVKQFLRLTDYPILHLDYDSDRRETHIINCWEITEMTIEEKKVAAQGLATHPCNGCLI